MHPPPALLAAVVLLLCGRTLSDGNVLFSVDYAGDDNQLERTPPSAPAAAADNDSEVQAVLAQFKLAQEAVSAGWQYNAGAACRSASVHGDLPKRGDFQSVGLAVRRRATSRRALAAAGVPIYSRGQAFISHQYKFIYLRQPKASSTSILAAIQTHYCNNSTCTHDQLHRESRTIDPDTWRNYFVWTVVRNPIARMLSTFLMFKSLLRRRLPDSPHPGEHCGPSFAEFAQNPFRLRETCATDSCCTFLHERGGEMLYGWFDHFVDSHISQQSHVLFTPSGDAVVDFIGRTEHLSEDWPRIVERIAARAPHAPQDVDMPTLNAHVTRDNVTLASGPAWDASASACLSPDVLAMGLLNETTARQMAMRFAMDMQLLGYV